MTRLELEFDATKAELATHDQKQAESIAELGLIRRFREHLTKNAD